MEANTVRKKRENKRKEESGRAVEEAYVSMALLQVAEAVSRSTDLQDVLAAVVRITPMLVGVGTIAILVRDEASRAFLPAAQYGLGDKAEEAFRALHLYHRSLTAA